MQKIQNQHNWKKGSNILYPMTALIAVVFSSPSSVAEPDPHHFGKPIQIRIWVKSRIRMKSEKSGAVEVNPWAVEAHNGAMELFRATVADSHNFLWGTGSAFKKPDPHQKEKSDPDPHRNEEKNRIQTHIEGKCQILIRITVKVGPEWVDSASQWKAGSGSASRWCGSAALAPRVEWMRSSQVVRASSCQCQSRNSSPGFDPSILRHSGIWGAADAAVLNNVHLKNKPIQSPL
jgi:hypothetical protein